MKRKQYLISISLVIIIQSICLAQSDWQFRSQYELRYKYDENTSIGVKPKFWFNGIINKLNSAHIEIGIDRKINNWLTISPYYRHIIQYNTINIHEKRPQIDFSLTSNFNVLTLQSRNRIEYRIRDSNKSVRYRNKINLEIPVQNIDLAVAEEPFYDCTNKEYNKNRLYFDISLSLMENISVKLFYIMESIRKGSKWQNINIIGTTIKLKL